MLNSQYHDSPKNALCDRALQDTNKPLKLLPPVFRIFFI